MPIRSTSPMVVVSNRLPFTVVINPETGIFERKMSAGGLVTAVAPVVVETGGLWVGWPGIYSDTVPIKIPEADPEDQSPTAGLKTSQVIPVDLKKEMFDKYYNGCCNACFWPLFHSMPDRATFEGDKWEAYKTVNEEFAQLTVEAIRRLKKECPDSIPLVWLHDYHLMLAANHIRDACDEEGLTIKMAFFLHIPFPSWDIMRLFPWEDELLQGMLGCDSLGFHINDYCWNFIDCCKRRLGSRVDRDRMLVEHNNRTVEINTLPISIPYERFGNLAKKAKSVLDVGDNKQLLLGVDRLDYTKGLVHRIRAFELLLEKYPEHKENVIFFQVAVPSRTDVAEYQELKEELDQVIGSVNGKFSTPNWSPVRYIYGCIPQEQLSGFYRDASVAVVTPLRDGMNLVAKEFVACQTNEPGVLVLSPFAGSAEFMKEAILVNPYETNAFADVLHRALTLSEEERELRMVKLRKREKKHDVNYWLRSFLISVECLETENKRASHVATLSEEDFSQYLSKYVTEFSNLAILLDYDGTLTPIKPHPDLAVLPQETKAILERLAKLPDVHLAIISGRSVKNVKEMVGIEGITYAGNHGLEIIHPDGTMFHPTIPQDYTTRLDDLREKLKDSCQHGAWVEDKGSVITYHYIKVPNEERGSVLSGARKAFENSGIKISYSHNAFEGRPPIHWDKGRAAIHILRTLFGVDWSDRVSTIFVGDDNTDEDAIRALQGMAVTFRVTKSQNIRTAATHRLPHVGKVQKMLKWIARRLEKRDPGFYNANRTLTEDDDQDSTATNAESNSVSAFSVQV